jgi:hypothetical protein
MNRRESGNVGTLNGINDGKKIAQPVLEKVNVAAIK